MLSTVRLAGNRCLPAEMKVRLRRITDRPLTLARAWLLPRTDHRLGRPSLFGNHDRRLRGYRDRLCRWSREGWGGFAYRRLGFCLPPNGRRSRRQLQAVRLADNRVLGNSQALPDHRSRMTGIPELGQLFNTFWRPGHGYSQHVEVLPTRSTISRGDQTCRVEVHNILWKTPTTYGRC